MLLRKVKRQVAVGNGGRITVHYFEITKNGGLK
jgi:hypothetical protein